MSIGFMWLSLFLGLVLEVLPLPFDMMGYRPEFVYLIVIFWCVHSRAQNGVYLAFFLGLLLDLLQGNLIGIHAALLLGMVSVLRVFFPQFRVYGLWHQCMALFGVLIVSNVVYAMTQNFSFSVQELLIAPLFSIIVWPILRLLLSLVTTSGSDLYSL